MTDAALSARLARAVWTLYEPIHAVTYFAREPREAFEDRGVNGFLRGYFAGRSAPFGPIGPAPVTAIFASFAPSLVERSLPGVWDVVTPEVALRTRMDGAAASIRRALATANVVVSVDLVDQLVSAATDLPIAGRPLAAANAALEPYDDPIERLWQATTTLREWRGDAHIAALVANGIAGLDILVLRDTVENNKERMQKVRGWTDDQWFGAAAALGDRGLLDGGELSDEGRAVIARVERATDDSSVLGSIEQMRSLGVALFPVATACATLLSYPNPIGLPAAWDPVGDPDAENVKRAW